MGSGTSCSSLSEVFPLPLRPSVSPRFHAYVFFPSLTWGSYPPHLPLAVCQEKCICLPSIQACHWGRDNKRADVCPRFKPCSLGQGQFGSVTWQGMCKSESVFAITPDCTEKGIWYVYQHPSTLMGFSTHNYRGFHDSTAKGLGCL